MTKDEAKTIKKVLPDFCKPYYVSKTETLRVRVYSFDAYIDKNGTVYQGDPEKEKERILQTLTALTENGFRPPYTIEHRTYQGFIHDTNLLFS